MSLDVTRKSILEVLSLLDAGEWQVPQFQREFVWTPQQVTELLTSIFKSRPIGLITAWAQPQNAPLTPPEPIKLKAKKFGSFPSVPPVIKLILDGKQRLTTLAIAFGGLRNPDDRYSYSGRWFVDFKVSPRESDSFIVYKQRRQENAEGLDKLSNCIAAGLLPLDECKELSRIAQRIYQADFYPKDKLPTHEDLERRAAFLAEYQDTFATFQIPIAELPSSLTLADVCEIFEVLNTTGTKVSTFDLIHNTAFGDTDGKFNLRDLFEEIQGGTQKLRLLCDRSRPEFFCQLVTGVYLSEPKPLSRTSRIDKEAFVNSIKGGDLINTPTKFYQQFMSDLSLIQSFANDLFADVLQADFRLREIPYPAPSFCISLCGGNTQST